MNNKLPNIIRKLQWKNYISSMVWYIFKGFNDIKQNLDLFSNAIEISIYAGELYSGFYNDENLIENLSETIAGGGKINVVFGPALFVDINNFLKFGSNQANVKLYKRNYRDPAHFKIVKYKDMSKCAIIDTPHNFTERGREETRSIILLYKGYENEIRSLNRKFENKLKETKLINIDNIIEEFSERGRNENGDFYGFITEKNGNIEVAEESEIEKLKRYLTK